MATLAANVNATEGLWTISADHPDTVDFLQVDDEIVAVTADFPSSTYAPTGATTPPKIRVERGAGGTTAASHSSGATLTPVIPPAAGTGGAAEAGTVVEVATDEPPAEQRGFYYGETEPIGAGEGSYWVDLTGGPPYQTKVLSGGIWVIAPMILKDVSGVEIARSDVGENGASLQVGAYHINVFVDGSIDLVGIGTITIDDAGVVHMENAAQSASLDLNADGSIALGSVGAALTLEANGNVYINSLPTADPVAANRLWNDAGTVKVSAG